MTTAFRPTVLLVNTEATEPDAAISRALGGGGTRTVRSLSVHDCDPVSLPPVWPDTIVVPDADPASWDRTKKEWFRDALRRVLPRRDSLRTAPMLAPLVRQRLIVACRPAVLPSDAELRRHLLGSDPDLDLDVNVTCVAAADPAAIDKAMEGDPADSRVARILFAYHTLSNLERWRRVESPAELYAPRSQILNTLKLTVERAAHGTGDPPPGGTPLRPWVDQVFASLAFLFQFRIAFRNAFQSEYVQPPAGGGDLRVALTPGLLVAVLVETWVRALGRGSPEPVPPDAATPPKPLCRVTADEMEGVAGVSFFPLPGSDLAATLDGHVPLSFEVPFLCLRRLGFYSPPAGGTGPPGESTFDLNFPLVPPGPTSRR